MLLINGSIRPRKTTYQFAKAFEAATESYCDVIWVHDYKDKIEELLLLINRHDVIGIFSPLYVDSLPAVVIEVMEKLMPYKDHLAGKSLFSFGQSGFPDPTRIVPLNLMCRCFAEAMDMNWLGGIAHGGGVIIDGRPIESLGKKGVRLMSGAEKVVSAVSRGHYIPQDAHCHFRSDVPVLLFPLLAWHLNNSAKKEAKKNDVDLYDRYYLRQS